MDVLVDEMGRQTALRINVVQVIDVNVDGPRGGNSAPRLKPAAAFSMSVRIKVLRVLSCTHVCRVVV